jgi:hypothetical protein
VDGDKPIVFEGANTEVIIRESGEVVYRDEIPPEVEPLKAPGLFLRASQTTVNPGTTDEEGSPLTYVRNWAHTYVAASNEDVQACLAQLHQRLSNPPE